MFSATSLPATPACPQQFEKILHQRHLEVQLSEAKLAQHNVVAAEEKELSLQERHQVRRVEDESNYVSSFVRISAV